MIALIRIVFCCDTRQVYGLEILQLIGKLVGDYLILIEENLAIPEAIRTVAWMSCLVLWENVILKWLFIPLCRRLRR